MSERMMVFEEHNDEGVPTGRTISLSDIEFRPLTYAELLSLKLGESVTVPLRWNNATILASNIPGLEVQAIVSGNAPVNAVYSSKAVGLVKDGWLPSGLAVTNGMIILPDRCVVSALKARFLDGSKRHEHDKDFLDFFAKPGIRLNPLLFALEGNMRTHPGADTIKQQLEEAFRSLRVALPAAELVPNEAGGLKGVLGLAHDSQGDVARKQRFLLEVAPMLTPPTSASKRAELWDAVLSVADKHEIPARSLVVIAALSAIMKPMKENPAKGVLKFRPSYNEGDAYNALADIRSLDVLMGLFALFPDQPLMLCTTDKDLALFWAGLRASDFHFVDGRITFFLAPDSDLLPGMTAAQRVVIFGEEE